MENSTTKKQLIRFIISGCMAVATDCIFYYILSKCIDLSISKAISFMLGTITAYLMNKYFTFEQTEKSIKEIFKFIVLYITSLCANVGVNKLCLFIIPIIFFYFPILNKFEYVKLFSFLCATGTSTIINFIGQKYWVFKK